MKTIGLLGGMSWESTVPYYQIINRVVRERLGGLHSARILLYSVDFHDIEKLQHAGRWTESGRILADAAARLESAGADFIVLCTNTMHGVAPQIEGRIRIPLLHVADATASEIKRQGVGRIALLVTRFTMEQDFYKGRLLTLHGLDVVIPPLEDRELIHRIIYEELCVGRVLPASHDDLRRIAAALVERGAEGIILGCTEISMLLGPADATVPLFDTTAIHARAAALYALDQRGA